MDDPSVALYTRDSSSEREPIGGGYAHCKGEGPSSDCDPIEEDETSQTVAHELS